MKTRLTALIFGFFVACSSLAYADDAPPSDAPGNKTPPDVGSIADWSNLGFGIGVGYA